MNSKHEKVSDKEESDQTTSNGSHVIEVNSCEVVRNSNNNVDNPPQLPEKGDCVDGTFASDELRPLKKAKSTADENHSSNESNNGLFNFNGFQQMAQGLSSHLMPTFGFLMF
ncbi:hypothetical protein LOK49_LG13G00230 [Camellia lanceoleosa]|uniref:Uncharacterized protein n=1 Tax=Camellia lanceoleosa TaxID=1840588 RepID=A0ACC0FI37_9ERIC|nr:hypothetical protein LOK49_LG13G00230 [Camellia lanceoleosa]